MKWSNAFHNFANMAIALLAALEFFDWGAFFAPETAMKLVGALALAKIVVNVVRDGLAGMVAEQPPVRRAPEPDYSEYS